MFLHELGSADAPTDTRAENLLVDAYKEALGALSLAAPPKQLHEILSARVACGGAILPELTTSQRFLVSWMLGRVGAQRIFAMADAAEAVELLCFARVFLLVARISRHFSASTSHTGTSFNQMLHALDADCEQTLRAFFARAPCAVAASGTVQLTDEQQQFVAHDAERTSLIRVQAFAGVRQATRNH